jgi:putative transposase
MRRMRLAYKCRVYPTQEQEALLRRTFGCVRYVWNTILGERHERYLTENKGTSYAEAAHRVVTLKQEAGREWLREVSAVALQQTIRHQEQAFAAFFAKRSRYPRFKNWNSKRSASFSRAGFTFRNGVLIPAKFCSPLRYVWSWPNVDPVSLDPTSITISCDAAGRFFVSFFVEVEATNLESTDHHVGVDVGLSDIATLSTGQKVQHPRHMDKHERRLKRYQRMMARRKKGSANREKARRKVARQHAKVADARRDHLHKLTTQLVRENAVIAVEDLNIRGMVRNRTFSKAVSRTGFGEFRSQLEYKCERYGRKLIVIDRWFPSSKTCSHCGHLLDRLSLKTRHWTCPQCGTRHDRDINAAKNILAAGLAVSACGGDVRPAELAPGLLPVKQELDLLLS